MNITANKRVIDSKGGLRKPRQIEHERKRLHL
jgi:hypothetical protein